MGDAFGGKSKKKKSPSSLPSASPSLHAAVPSPPAALPPPGQAVPPQLSTVTLGGREQAAGELGVRGEDSSLEASLISADPCVRVPLPVYEFLNRALLNTSCAWEIC